MKVKEAIEKLQKMDPEAELCDYSPCGPSRINDIYQSQAFPGDVILDVGFVCPKIMECGPECALGADD